MKSKIAAASTQRDVQERTLSRTGGQRGSIDRKRSHSKKDQFLAYEVEELRKQNSSLQIQLAGCQTTLVKA